MTRRISSKEVQILNRLTKRLDKLCLEDNPKLRHLIEDSLDDVGKYSMADYIDASDTLGDIVYKDLTALVRTMYTPIIETEQDRVMGMYSKLCTERKKFCEDNNIQDVDLNEALILLLQHSPDTVKDVLQASVNNNG